MLVTWSHANSELSGRFARPFDLRSRRRLVQADLTQFAPEIVFRQQLLLFKESPHSVLPFLAGLWWRKCPGEHHFGVDDREALTFGHRYADDEGGTNDVRHVR